MKSKSSLSQAEKVTLCAALYRTGMSTRDIEVATGIGKSSIPRYLKIAGVAVDGATRIAAKATGRPSARLGAKHDESAKAKMSARAIGNKYCVGRTLSVETIEKIRASNILAHPKKPRQQRPVFVGPRKPRGNWMDPGDRKALRHARAACKRMLRRILTMARVRKDLPTEQLLGYSKKQLRSHLEAQFKPGMSWEDRDSFHIDHIIPVAHFVRNGIFDPAVINALSNLQVLTPKENWAKSDTITDSGVQAGIVDLA